jgi:tetratricopeptide (TPR) repeat protein
MFRQAAAAFAVVLCCASPATAKAALDLDALWDFGRPAVSEQRFRAALAQAQGDDALILRTQIARSLGLRRDFDGARRELIAIAPALAQAGAEVRVRHALEWGRSHSSAAHPPATQTDAARAEARQAFTRAAQAGRDAGLDALAVDALHMMAFVDTAPAQQVAWNRQALALALASTQPAARRWEASLRNNLGLSLHELGRYQEALDEFRRLVALREAAARPERARQARWMVAWTLRSMGRMDEALDMQLALERDNEAAGTPDRFVFEELAALYRARGDAQRADHNAARAAALAKD